MEKIFVIKKFTKSSDSFGICCCILYSVIKLHEEVIQMDMALMRKLNRQGILIVTLHMLIMLNFAFELMLLNGVNLEIFT